MRVAAPVSPAIQSVIAGCRLRIRRRPWYTPLRLWFWRAAGDRAWYLAARGRARTDEDHVFICRNLERLRARGVDIYSHPGTHDFVAFDVSWGGRRYPQIPVYLRANSGHGKRKGHPAAEKGEQNKSAFLLQHFFDGVEPMLQPPSVSYEVKDTKLSVRVQFKAGSGEESGRIWWMYDRGPDGSAAYVREMIPDDQSKEMGFDTQEKTWVVGIELKKGASHIDFFTNHRKTVKYKARNYRTYISSPYTRVAIIGS